MTDRYSPSHLLLTAGKDYHLINQNHQNDYDYNSFSNWYYIAVTVQSMELFCLVLTVSYSLRLRSAPDDSTFSTSTCSACLWFRRSFALSFKEQTQSVLTRLVLVEIRTLLTPFPPDTIPGVRPRIQKRLVAESSTIAARSPGIKFRFNLVPHTLLFHDELLSPPSTEPDSVSLLSRLRRPESMMHFSPRSGDSALRLGHTKLTSKSYLCQRSRARENKRAHFRE